MEAFHQVRIGDEGNAKGHKVCEAAGEGSVRFGLALHRSGVVHAIETHPRLCVNDPLAVHRMVMNDAGVGVISGYLCAPEMSISVE